MDSEAYADHGDMERKSQREEEQMLEQRNAVERLLYWRQGGTSFTCILYELMLKADHRNFARLAIAFPEESSALMAWRSSKDEQRFFHQYGLILQERYAI